MQILELSTGGHKVESMKWNGETLYRQRLPFDTYVYDIEIKFKDGAVDTFIDKATFKITEEVH